MKKPAGPMGLMDHIESILAHRTLFGASSSIGTLRPLPIQYLYPGVL